MGRIVAFLFPGQGRVPEELPPRSELSDRLYAAAGRAGLPLREWILEGATARLSATEAAQPALLIDSLARAVALQGIGVAANFVAGHSLGEYAALASVGVLAPADALKIVIERGRLMDGVSGTMAAIVKLDLDTVRTLCEKDGPNVSVANHNGPAQVVVSGRDDAVRRVMAQATEQGGRAIPLTVSGPFHSRFMQPAQAALNRAVEQTPFRVPSVPVVSGVSGRVERDPFELKELLQRQMTACVRWVDVVRRLEECGATLAIEVGVGDVLTGLGKRISNSIRFVTYKEALDDKL